MAGALDGVRVVEVAHFVQGPQCGALLHDLGADVVKLELPGEGDHGRRLQIGPGDERSPYFHANNRGKRSFAIDIAADGAREVIRRLLERSDVLFSAIRPGAMDRLGLGYEACQAINPRLVYASASTFGPRGALANDPGVDLIAQAYGGLASRTGSPEHPTIAGATVADSAGAQMLCCGILAALLARERSGRGQRVDSSLYGAQIWAQSSELSYQLIAGRAFDRVAGGQPNLSHSGLYGVYRTADGAIGLGGVRPEQWDAFCGALEAPAWREDPRFATTEARARATESLREAVRSVLRTRSTAAWMERLAATDVRHVPVQSYPEVERDPQAHVNGYLLETEHPDWGPMVNIGSPLELSDTPLTPAVRAPSIGEHTLEVLRELGYDEAAITTLAESGVIGLAA